MFRAVLMSAIALFTAQATFADPQAEAVISNAALELAAGELDAHELTELVDTNAIARFTLGRHVRGLADERVSAYANAFKGFLESTFDSYAHRFTGANIAMTGSVDRSTRDSIVTTRVSMPGGTPEMVRWRLMDRGGAWKVVDVQVQGLWLAIEQRAQIDALLDRSGSIDQAIESLGTPARDFADTSDQRG
ncbi:MAG: ABC transporter substrate-binding protein [Pseudomonadota bacterium]